jgi:hypothetical protein
MDSGRAESLISLEAENDEGYAPKQELKTRNLGMNRYTYDDCFG